MAVNWEELGKCPTCLAAPGQQCVNLRTFGSYNDVPHKARRFLVKN